MAISCKFDSKRKVTECHGTKTKSISLLNMKSFIICKVCLASSDTFPS
jgi:hypothetical protein